jgi:hypothetical protein
MYLAALGNLTAAAGADETECVPLRELVDQAEIALEFADTQIRRHQVEGSVAGQTLQRAFAAATRGRSVGAD